MLMENEEIKDYMVKKSVGIATKSFAKILVASVTPLVAGFCRESEANTYRATVE